MRHTPDWHAQQNQLERNWLDQWTRGHINPTTLHPHEPVPIAAPVPVLAGSTR